MKGSQASSARLSTAQYAALKRLLSDQYWRLNHLYWIVDKDGAMQRFRMNWAQEELYRNQHTRNNILKVRQLGISTFVAMLILDCSLFKKNHASAVVDRTMPDACEKLAKMRFAFNHLDYLPENANEMEQELAEIGRMIKSKHAPLQGKKEYEPIGQEKADFLNGSKIRIGATLRGGTCHLLHVSELASIARNFPRRATEILTGTKETVGKNCRIFFESTHEGGRYGVNYEQVMLAMSKIGQELTPMDSKFFFFPWYKHPDYVMEGFKPRPTAERGHLQAYFEPAAHRPIYTAWDLGTNDYTSIWWVQPNGHGKWLVLANYTANNLALDYYIGVLREMDVKLGRCAKCILPHDGTRHDMYLNTYAGEFQKAGYSTTLVPRTQNRWMSIEHTRELLTHCIFHARCSEETNVDGVRYIAGVDALKDYRVRPPGPGGSESREPLHDITSHASDAMRTFADAVQRGLVAAETGWGPAKNGARRKNGQSDYVRNLLN